MSPSPEIIARVDLPTYLYEKTINKFIGECFFAKNKGANRIIFQVHGLAKIDVVGVVTFCNLIAYLSQFGIKILITGHIDNGGQAISYLDNVGFFERYTSKRITENIPPFDLRSAPLPIEIIKEDRFRTYVFNKLTPWISRNLGVSEVSLATFRASLEEIYQNVCDHSRESSGTGIGFSLVEHDTWRSKLEIAVADFGVGIPDKVRLIKDIPKDFLAIKEACKEGFTTKSNVRNRGYGLHNLIKIVSRINGEVLICSYGGIVRTVSLGGNIKIMGEPSNEVFPGTLIKVSVDVNEFDKHHPDFESEVLEW
jgi:anti-sigma regulatory factor (Ser/Thr protein kinase)